MLDKEAAASDDVVRLEGSSTEDRESVLARATEGTEAIGTSVLLLADCVGAGSTTVVVAEGGSLGELVAAGVGVSTLLLSSCAVCECS